MDQGRLSLVAAFVAPGIEPDGLDRNPLFRLGIELPAQHRH
jgi:hypothetical protein